MKRALTLVLTLLIGLTTLSGVQAAAPAATTDPLEVIDWVTPQIDAFYETLFALQGPAYHAPTVTILLEDETVYTGCGPASGSMIAFYCPVDEQIVIGLDTLEWTAERDDFAPAYVLAHEWAHHAQHLSGTAPVPDPPAGDWNRVYTIENELRADCMSGAFFQNLDSRGLLDATDMSGVLILASEIGDIGIWGRGSSHGVGQERLRAVFTGYEYGVFGCMAITPMPRVERIPS